MEENNFFAKLWSFPFFLIFSTVFLGLATIIIVATNDYVSFEFYNIAQDMVTQNIAPAYLLPAIENIADTVVGILKYFDIFWAAAFMLFVVGYVRSSYYAKREGYMTTFGFISFGIMAMLFLFNLIVTYNATIYDLFFNKVLANASIQLTLFNFYMTNFQIVNLILIVIGIIVNFVPFDISVFNRRKAEDLMQEVQ